MQVDSPLSFGGTVAQGYARPRAAAARPAVRTPAAGDALYSLRAGEVWRFIRGQPFSFWTLNAYLFFEYVRPQQIYGWLAGPPWAQISLWLTVGAFLMEGSVFRLKTITDHLLIVFTLVIVLSSANAWSPEVAFGALPDKFLSWVLIYLLIVNVVSTERRFLVFMLAWLLYSFKMSQHGTRSWADAGFAFQGGGVTGAPGPFQNSGEFGVQMAMFIPVVCYFTAALRPYFGKKALLLFYTMVVTAVTGTIGSSSRGAMIAAAVTVVFMVLKTERKVKGLAIVALLVVFVQVMLPPEQRARFDAIGDDKTSLTRKRYWAFGGKVIDQYPVLGIGFSNWAVYYQKYNGYKALPHNIFIEVTAELGYVGMAVFAALIVATFGVNRATRRRMRALGERGRFITAMAHGLDGALLGFLVAGQFVTVTYYPFFWINLAFTASLSRAADDLLTREATGHRPLAARGTARVLPASAMRGGLR